MDLFSESTRRDPYPVYERLRAAGPVLHLPGPDLWVALSYDAVKRVLHDQAAFSSNVGPTRGIAFEWLLFTDPPRHTELRALISRAFTPRSIAGLEPRIGELSRQLLDGAGDDFDLVAGYASPLPMMVIAEMLGLPADDWPMFARWSEAIINLGNTIAGTGAEEASRAFAVADREMTDYLADRAGTALMARLSAAGLAPAEVVRFCQLLIAAGTETTTNLISNAMLCIADHPETRDRIPETIEEVLRHRTPVQAMFRATRGAVELAGVRIPPGRMVIACIGAANRDPAVFADPDRFDLARDPNPHLAFGHGIHFCLGAPLSRLEARIALTDLLARFPHFELDRDWKPRGSFHVHGPAALAIRSRSRRR
jgi:cytochrome P450